MKKTLISIVVPTYNRSEMICDALESIANQQTDGTFIFEIIIVDNASTDDTKSVVDKFIRSMPTTIIRYIYEAAEGQANALNAGVKESKGQWIAFFDDDQLAEPNWLKELFKVAVTNGAKCVGGAVHLDLTAEKLSRLNPIARKFLREIRYYEEPHRYEKKKYQLPSSGNMLVARDVFNLIGSFDGSMLMGAFDTDFCLRARNAGVDLWFAPDAIIRHRFSPNRLTPKYYRWGELKNGVALAYLDYKYKGVCKTMFFCIARIGQAILINLPFLVFGFLKGNQGEVQGRKCLLFRAVGYTRKTQSLIMPRIMAQSNWISMMDQRKGLSVGSISFKKKL